MANTITSKNMTFPPESPRKGHEAMLFTFLRRGQKCLRITGPQIQLCCIF